MLHRGSSDPPIDQSKKTSQKQAHECAPPKSMPYRQIFPYSPAVPHLCQPNTRWQTRPRTNLDTDSGPVVFSTDVMNWKCWGG